MTETDRQQVDGGAPLCHDAVHLHAFAGATVQHVAGAQLVSSYVYLATVGHATRGRLERDRGHAYAVLHLGGQQTGEQ